MGSVSRIDRGQSDCERRAAAVRSGEPQGRDGGVCPHQRSNFERAVQQAALINAWNRDGGIGISLTKGAVRRLVRRCGSLRRPLLRCGDLAAMAKDREIRRKLHDGRTRRSQNRDRMKKHGAGVQQHADDSQHGRSLPSASGSGCNHGDSKPDCAGRLKSEDVTTTSRQGIKFDSSAAGVALTDRFQAVHLSGLAEFCSHAHGFHR